MHAFSLWAAYLIYPRKWVLSEVKWEVTDSPSGFNLLQSDQTGPLRWLHHIQQPLQSHSGRFFISSSDFFHASGPSWYLGVSISHLSQ